MSKFTNKILGMLRISNNIKTMRNGFTLAEVLIATVIIGIIAGLAIPSVVTTYQNRALQEAFNRQIHTLEATLNMLPVYENCTTFNQTSLYKEDAKASDLYDSTKDFIEKYLRVTKICGVTGDGNVSGCFSNKYYVVDKSRSTKLPLTYGNAENQINFADYGVCATLRNGVAMCMTPKIGDEPIKVLIDINGTKGPNILGKDLRSAKLNISSGVNAGDPGAGNTAEVAYLNGEPTELPCLIDNNSLECCKTTSREQNLSGPSDPCCKVFQDKPICKDFNNECKNPSSPIYDTTTCCKTQARLDMISDPVSDYCCTVSSSEACYLELGVDISCQNTPTPVGTKYYFPCTAKFTNDHGKTISVNITYNYHTKKDTTNYKKTFKYAKNSSGTLGKASSRIESKGGSDDELIIDSCSISGSHTSWSGKGNDCYNIKETVKGSWK